jgi:putative membrane protein
MMLEPILQKNDKQAKLLIGIFSVVVLVAVTFLSKFTLVVELPFDKHIFALVNALLNATVAVLLIAALVAVKQQKYAVHKNIMLIALLLSVLFLVSYIAHHLFAGETKFGDTDHDGLVSAAEIAVVGNTRSFYFILLATHIILAATSLPFILFTAYRGLTGEFENHKKIARRIWPIWFYVAVTGPLVYMMIKPYYN